MDQIRQLPHPAFTSSAHRQTRTAAEHPDILSSTRRSQHRTSISTSRHGGHTYELSTRKGKFRAARVVVAAGAWSNALLDRVAPELSVLPVVSAESTAVTLRPNGPVPLVVLRTPDRAYACELRAVPQADGSWYLGASAAPALRPGDAPTAVPTHRDGLHAAAAEMTGEGPPFLQVGDAVLDANTSRGMRLALSFVHLLVSGGSVFLELAVWRCHRPPVCAPIPW